MMKFRSGQSFAAFSRSKGVQAFSLNAPSGRPLWTHRFLTPSFFVFSQKG